MSALFGKLCNNQGGSPTHSPPKQQPQLHHMAPATTADPANPPPSAALTHNHPSPPANQRQYHDYHERHGDMHPHDYFAQHMQQQSAPGASSTTSAATAHYHQHHAYDHHHGPHPADHRAYERRTPHCAHSTPTPTSNTVDHTARPYAQSSNITIKRSSSYDTRAGSGADDEDHHLEAGGDRARKMLCLRKESFDSSIGSYSDFFDYGCSYERCVRWCFRLVFLPAVL